jgi:hypothetical protein
MINCKINTDLKYVKIDEANYFYFKFYNYLTDYEFIRHFNHESYSFTFKMNMQNEVMQYWTDKGYTKGFSNLVLKFEL